MVAPVASMARKRPMVPLASGAFFQPTRSVGRCSPSKPASRLQVRATMKEKAAAGLTAAALVLPDIAEAAQPGVSTSLKNFLFSIVAGGVVLTVLFGAVVAVANFDPLKRT